MKQRENKTIVTKYILATYMVNFGTSDITRNEYYSFADFLKRNVSTKNTKYDVLYGKEYLEQLRNDNDRTFNIGPKYISLESGLTLNYLRRFVLTRLDNQTLEDLLETTKKYEEMIHSIQQM